MAVPAAATRTRSQDFHCCGASSGARRALSPHQMYISQLLLEVSAGAVYTNQHVCLCASLMIMPSAIYVYTYIYFVGPIVAYNVAVDANAARLAQSKDVVIEKYTKLEV
jgi:hypothetical protein